MKTAITTFLIICTLIVAHDKCVASPAETEYTDSVRALGELNVVALKQQERLRDDAMAATVIGRAELEELNAVAVKSISDVVPNFYVPDYGSRITSTM